MSYSILKKGMISIKNVLINFSKLPPVLLAFSDASISVYNLLYRIADFRSDGLVSRNFSIR